MKNLRRTGIGIVALLAASAVACGKPAQAPDGNTGITETSSKEDMPPPPAKEADPTAPASTPEPAAVAGPAGGVIKLGSLKLTPVKKGKVKSVELKDDGTVQVDGKPAAKIKGDQVDSTGGTSMLTVGVDDSLVGNGVRSGFKFEGDDLVADGVKLSVGDDGAITATPDGGKPETIVKVEGGASAKRAALIVAVLYLNIPGNPGAPAPKPAKKK